MNLLLPHRIAAGIQPSKRSRTRCAAAQILSVTCILTLAVMSFVLSAMADPVPSGTVLLGHDFIEPAYNAFDGTPSYFLRPSSEVQNDSRKISPMYLVIYPSTAAGTIGAVNCQHQPLDNCPDHGPDLAALAMTSVPGVYGGGVWGHDHLLAARPTPKGQDEKSEVAWIPVIVLFTNAAAANTHITTFSQLNAALAAGDVTTIELTPLAFRGNVVSAAPYQNGTPVAPVAPEP